jgi:signal transduction histidine kinase
MEFGLNQAITSLVRTIELGCPTKFHLQLDKLFEHSLTTNHQLHLYRIAQETIINILKHAQAAAFGMNDI